MVGAFAVTSPFPQVLSFFFRRNSPRWARASSFTRFLDHTQRRTAVGRIPLDEWLARRRDLYMTTHNTHNRQISMPPVVFERTVSAGERPQTHALDRAAIGTGPPVLGQHEMPKPVRNDSTSLRRDFTLHRVMS